MGDGRCPSAPTGASLLPSLQPFGVSGATTENRLFEQKRFLSGIANVLVSQDSRTEISPLPACAGSSPGRWTSTASLLSLGGLWEGAWRCSGTPWHPRWCRAGALLWKLGKYPRKYVGAGLDARLETHLWEQGGVLGSPPGSALCPALQTAA